jgi:hypothetical protein
VDADGRPAGSDDFQRDRLQHLRPQAYSAEIAPNPPQTRYPQYLEPPPLGDARPNGTTWTVTKQWIDAQRAKAKEKK